MPPITPTRAEPGSPALVHRLPAEPEPISVAAMRLSTAGSSTPDVEPEVDEQDADAKIADKGEDETVAYHATDDETVGLLQADEALLSDRQTGNAAPKSGPGDALIGPTP